MKDELPTPESALKAFYTYPLPPSKDATPQFEEYEKRVTEIDTRLAALQSPQSNQSSVRAVRRILLGSKISTPNKK